jgi:hypothetical protein
MVYGSDFKLCGVTRTDCGAGGLVFNWSGCHDDFCLLGSFHLARIFSGTSTIKNLSSVDVPVVSCRPERNRFGSDLLKGKSAILFNIYEGVDEQTEANCRRGEH